MSYGFSISNAAIRRPFHTSVIKWSLSHCLFTQRTLSFYCSHAHTKVVVCQRGRLRPVEGQLTWQYAANESKFGVLSQTKWQNWDQKEIFGFSCYIIHRMSDLSKFLLMFTLCLLPAWLQVNAWMPLNEHTWMCNKVLESTVHTVISSYMILLPKIQEGRILQSRII